MPIVDFLLVITLALLAVVLLRGRTQNQQQQLEDAFKRQQLEDAFYRLLQEQGSCISLIQLTAAARVDVQQARQYLDRQVQLFCAVPEVDADGDTFYRFPKLHRRPSLDKSL
jgi:transcriptional regulator of heat shock response